MCLCVCVCVFDIINPKLWGGLKSKEGGTHQGCAVVSQLIEKTLYQSSPVHGSSQRLFLFGFIKIKQTCPAPARGHRQKPKIVLAVKQNVQSIDKDWVIGRSSSHTHTHTHTVTCTQRTHRPQTNTKNF